MKHMYLKLKNYLNLLFNIMVKWVKNYIIVGKNQLCKQMRRNMYQKHHLMNFYKSLDLQLQLKWMNQKIEKLKEDKLNYLLLAQKYDIINYVVIF